MKKRLKLSQDLLALEKKLTEMAKGATMKELAESLLRHPVHGPLLRAFADEEKAPEHDKFLKRLEALTKLVGKVKD